MKSWSVKLSILAAGLMTAASWAAGPAKAEKALAAPEQSDPAKMAADDIRTCLRSNFVRRGSLRDLQLKATDRDGQAHELKMKLFWKPAKSGLARMNLRVLEPKELHGSSYLLLERDKGQDVYFFLPANQTVLKVTGNEMARPLWGTDFSYSEIKQVQGLLEEGATKRLGDAIVSERPSFVLETTTKAETTGYRKVLSYIDQASCTLLKSEFFGKGEQPRKVLVADVSTLTKIDTYWLVLGYSMRNIAEGSHTELSMSDLYLLESKSEKLFDPERFYQFDE